MYLKGLENIIVKLELKRQVNIDLNISKEEFFVGLKKIMKSESESPLFSGLEIFLSDDMPFFGKFTDIGFTLRGRRVAGKSVRHLAIAKGVVEEKEKGLSISIEINAFRGRHRLALVLLGALYVCLFLVSLFVGVFKLQVDALLSLVFILLHGMFMISIPVFLLSKAARILEQDLVHEIEEIVNSYSAN
jgi:hypothetical protein